MTFSKPGGGDSIFIPSPAARGEKSLVFLQIDILSQNILFRAMLPVPENDTLFTDPLPFFFSQLRG